jgi:hypothetical protein
VQEYDSIIREHQADFDGWRADRVNGTSGEVVYVGDARPQNSVVIDAQGGIWRPRPSATNLFRTELVGRDVRVRINYEQFERK